MRLYSDANKADVRRRMYPPHWQSVALISEELGINVMTLCKWRCHGPLCELTFQSHTTYTSFHLLLYSEGRSDFCC
jgi:hypothetical protein